MQWLTLSALEPSLPAHCEPANDFLFRFSSTFHTCVPTPLAFASSTLGILSIFAWLFAQLPQIYKNYSIQSTSGLSIFFLVEWCLGDLGNLFGALFTHQATWQVAIGAYYVFVDLCLVAQWVWYEKWRHGRYLMKVVPRKDGDPGYGGGEDMEAVVVEGVSQSPTSSQDEVHGPVNKKGARPRPIFRTPTFPKDPPSEDEKPSSSLPATPGGTTIYRVGPSSPMPSPSPRTVLLIACIIAMAQASPLARLAVGAPESEQVIAAQPTPLENVGTVLSWLSTVLYLGSRLPQLFKNWRRKSTAGLSPHLFIAAFCGNTFYSTAMLTNPNVWHDFGLYGGGGWAGPEGNDKLRWTAAALPFFLGAAGVLGLDGSVGVQFLVYGESESKVVVLEEGRGTRWRWRRISGWMRGWVPSISEEGKGVEREALLERGGRHGDEYGAL